MFWVVTLILFIFFVGLRSDSCPSDVCLYLSDTGSDGQNCGLESPCQTLKKAFEVIQEEYPKNSATVMLTPTNGGSYNVTEPLYLDSRELNVTIQSMSEVEKETILFVPNGNVFRHDVCVLGISTNEYFGTNHDQDLQEQSYSILRRVRIQTLNDLMILSPNILVFNILEDIEIGDVHFNSSSDYKVIFKETYYATNLSVQRNVFNGKSELSVFDDYPEEIVGLFFIDNAFSLNSYFFKSRLPNMRRSHFENQKSLSFQTTEWDYYLNERIISDCVFVTIYGLTSSVSNIFTIENNHLSISFINCTFKTKHLNVNPIVINQAKYVRIEGCVFKSIKGNPITIWNGLWQRYGQDFVVDIVDSTFSENLQLDDRKVSNYVPVSSICCTAESIFNVYINIVDCTFEKNYGTVFYFAKFCFVHFKGVQVSDTILLYNELSEYTSLVLFCGHEEEEQIAQISFEDTTVVSSSCSTWSNCLYGENPTALCNDWGYNTNGVCNVTSGVGNFQQFCNQHSSQQDFTLFIVVLVFVFLFILCLLMVLGVSIFLVAISIARCIKRKKMIQVPYGQLNFDALKEQSPYAKRQIEKRSTGKYGSLGSLNM